VVAGLEVVGGAAVRWSPRPPTEGAAVEAWQIVAIAVFVLLPFALLVGFWPDSERLTSRGQPIERDWHPQLKHDPVDEHH
jgi:hypothetical protein